MAMMLQMLTLRELMIIPTCNELIMIARNQFANKNFLSKSSINGHKKGTRGIDNQVLWRQAIRRKLSGNKVSRKSSHEVSSQEEALKK